MTTGPLKPSISLSDHNGKAVDEAIFRGTHTIVFFGFSRCAVVCPRALSRLTDVLNRLGEAAVDRVRALYISVDPERDSPEELKAFLSDRAPRFLGLTGTKDQVESAQRAFRVFAKRKDDESAPDGYTIPHTAFMYVVGPDGRVVDHIPDVLSVDEVVARLEKTLANSLNQPSPVLGETGTQQTPGAASTSPAGHESLASLSKEQVASIRHIGNLARQLKGDWSNMMGPTDLNDGFGAYRFQLAYGAYALALAHFHRLPAAPGLFKNTFERLIEKMCHPDVWFYWRDASTGGGVGHTPRQEPNANPIKTDNIMYSAYLQTMTLLYNSLFDDATYTKPGCLKLDYDPFFWGDPEGFHFEYDQNSLNDRVYWNMVESGYLGVACEPSCVFQICNQPPIIGFRLNDELNGSNTAEEVTAGYVKAWEEFGGTLEPEGGYRTYVTTHNRRVVPSLGIGMDAWAATLMHSWNPELVEGNYERQRARSLVRHDDGTLSVVVNGVEGLPRNMLMLTKGGEFGWFAALAAEMGDMETLEGLLGYADKTFRPRYQDGGLTYPRNDDFQDERGNYTLNSPIQSNALLPLARLNVANGFGRLYKHPWGPKNCEHYQEPALTQVDFSIDVYRAVYMRSQRTLAFDLAVYEKGAVGTVGLSRVFERGDWSLRRDGRQVAWGDSNGLKGCEPEMPVRQDGDTLLLPISEETKVSFLLQWFGE